jgi:hypothetical protein
MKLVLLLLAYSGMGVYSLSYSEEILGNWKVDEMENSTINAFMGEDGFIYGKIVDSDQ